MSDNFRQDATISRRVTNMCEPPVDIFGLEKILERKRQFEDRRTAPRYRITAKVRMTIFADPLDDNAGRRRQGKLRFVREGMTRDMSLTGVCVVFSAALSTVRLEQLVGQPVKLKLELHRRNADHLSILGQIVWGREEGGLPVVGIQFTDVPEEDRLLLEEHCSRDDGEQSMLGRLWEAMVAD
ncbi:MAG: PilZ domain-containing protein [Acidobacteriota bacterium]|nr:MAG: PilZ domain-containing protein [Acidobacteriota bacterium]